jgi:hypothetical protein
MVADMSLDEQVVDLEFRPAEVIILSDKNRATSAPSTITLFPIIAALLRLWLTIRFELQLWNDSKNTFIFTAPKPQGYDVPMADMSRLLRAWLVEFLGMPGNDEFTLHDIRKMTIADYSARVGTEKTQLLALSTSMRHSLATADRYYDLTSAHAASIKAQQDLYRARGQDEAIPMLYNRHDGPFNIIDPPTMPQIPHPDHALIELIRRCKAIKANQLAAAMRAATTGGKSGPRMRNLKAVAAQCAAALADEFQDDADDDDDDDDSDDGGEAKEEKNMTYSTTVRLVQPEATAADTGRMAAAAAAAAASSPQFSSDDEFEESAFPVDEPKPHHRHQRAAAAAAAADGGRAPTTARPLGAHGGRSGLAKPPAAAAAAAVATAPMPLCIDLDDDYEDEEDVHDEESEIFAATAAFSADDDDDDLDDDDDSVANVGQAESGRKRSRF